MACTPRDDDAVPTSSNDAQSSAKFHSSDAAPDWRSWDQLEASPVSTSPPCWESEDDDDSGSSVSGPRPSDLYGKFTWKIESFSHISKRELRSNVFEVGGYKWYILVYPQGCDVCNHLSLFLCVADYDKLLPGWSHFAQFTIAVVNKDPKKSKYSDTLHRFCKKEHDWGWKKFMELSKVLDGFTVADTLVIKAQVQVIRENPHRPFRCLDCQYRRELVRVYLTNVEGICRRFVEEKREKLSKLMEDTVRWSSFRAFWSAVEENARRRLAREKTDVVLKAVVKRFFNEKEVTSTLVMDALYSGCKALDLRSRNKKGKSNGSDIEETSKPVVWMDKDVFVLAGDVLSLLERAATELLPPYKDDKGPQNRTKDASSGDDFGRDSVERDERRLTELGRCTIEMFVLAHLFSNHVEVAYCEAIALKRQEELIREEEAAGQAEIESKAKREAAEKEKRTKKKQAKQRRNNRKERDKDAEEKRDVVVQEPQRREDSTNGRVTKGCNLKGHEISSSATLETGDEEDELSGLETTDDVVGTLGPALENGDGGCTIWEREGSDLHHGMEASFSEGFCENLSQNGRSTRKRQQVLLDDSSSTCSSDSLPSVSAVSNGSLRGRSILPDQNHAIINRGRARLHNEGYDKDLRLMESDGMLRVCLDAGSTAEPSSSGSSAGLDPEMVIASLRERVQWLEQRLSEKEEEVVILQAQLSLYQHQMGTERPNQDRGPLDESTDQCEIIGTRDVGPSGPSVCCNGRSKSPAAIKSNESRLDVPGNSVVSNNGTHIHGVNPSGIHLMNEPSRHHHDNGVSDDQPRFSAAACEIAESNAVSQGSSASNLLTLKCSSEETVSASPSHTRTSLNGMISVMELSRPSSAPVLVATPRPSLPVLQLHSAPPLSRSVSAAGRLGHVTTETVTSGSSAMMQSPPVTPSYRNAAAGKMRSGNSPSQVGHSFSAATIASTSWPSPYMNAFAHGPRQIPSTLPCTAGSISQSSPFPQKTPFVYGQAVPMAANNVKADGTTDTTWATVTSAPEAEGILRENCLGTSSSPQSDSARTSMGGITFGTITPEMLHARRQQDQQNDCHSSGCNAEANSYTQDCHQPDYEINRLLQQLPQEQTAQEFSYHHQDSQCNSHSKAFQKYHYSHPQGLSEGGPCNYDVRHALATVAENVNSGHMLSEEFPHLDIINDLLDEDKNFGKALSVFLQQPNLGHNCLSSFHELQRLNAGQLRLETGSVHGNGYNDSKMGMTCNDDCLQLHSTEECTRTGLRDGMQVLGPFAHSPLVRSFIQHGPIDAISRHHWPGVDNTFPVTGNANGVQSGMDHIGYPVQSHNIPVAECSAFSLGQNGYSMYSPMKQM